MTWNQEPYLGKNPSLVPISNSEIQEFKTCRRAWWLKYYRGLSRKDKEVTGPLPLGTRVHNSLEAFYKDGKNPVDAYRDLLKVDAVRFAQSKEVNDEAKVKKFDSEAELGRIMVEGYMEWREENNVDDRLEVIEVEKKVSAVLLDGRVELQGKTDMKVRDRLDDARLIMDHKTAASFDVYHKNSHMSEQLLLYVMLEKMQDGDDTPVEGGIYNLLRKVKRGPSAKPPFYDRITVRFNDTAMSSFWTRVNGELRDMMSVRDALDAGADPQFVAYPTPTKDCSWRCPFFHACFMFDDGSAAEAWLENFTEVSDPYARYEENDGE